MIFNFASGRTIDRPCGSCLNGMHIDFERPVSVTLNYSDLHALLQIKEENRLKSYISRMAGSLTLLKRGAP